MALRATAQAAAIAAAATLLASSSALAAPAKPGPGTLSPRLAELASGQAPVTPKAEARTLSLPAHGPGSLLREGDRILVDVRLAGGGRASASSLRAAGTRIVDLSERYSTATVAVLPGSLRALAGVRGVESITEDLAPIVSGVGGGTAPRQTSVSTCVGSKTSEGDGQLHAAEARSQLDVDGNGVKVGVLSDSFDRDAAAVTHAPVDVLSGDLPGPGNPCGRNAAVQVLDDSAGGEDEGRAMTQIVHDLAPGAALAFATASSGELAFADNIRALKAAGSKVIVDDVTYFDEPFFQDGPISVAVNDVTGSGADYFSSAGNSNVINGGRNVASYEAPAFRDSGGCPAGAPATYATQCMDFDPSGSVDNTYGISVAPGRTVLLDLQWAQPWNGVTTDLDAYLLSSSNSLLAASEDTNVDTSQKPFEFLAWRNTSLTTQSVNLAINRYTAGGGGDGGTPRLKLQLLENGAPGVFPTEYTSSAGGDVVGPAIFGHNGAANAVSVGAVPFDDGSAVEDYSSRGPATLYFGPVTGTTPASPLASPQVLAKPDLSATDCGVTTFFASLVAGEWRFCGTSAAAPHAAAVAALGLDAKPSATNAQIRSALTSTAAPVDSFGHDAVGAGLVDALAALHALAPPHRTAPNTKITRAKVNRKRRKARFSFTGSGGSGKLSFQCRLDAKPYARCHSPKAYKHLKAGKHSFKVRARDAHRRADPTPAKKRFRIPK